MRAGMGIIALAAGWLAGSCGGEFVGRDDGGGGTAGGGGGGGGGTGGAQVGGGGGATGGGGGSGAAGGGGVDFSACTGPGQCVLQTPGCCGVCGKPELWQLDAIHESQVDAHRAATCKNPDEPCPGCASMPNPDLFAYCAGVHCKGADVKKHPIGACAIDEDCRLRWSLRCCEGCAADASDVTAIGWAHEEELMNLVCDPGEVCPECVPQPFPPNVFALCQGGQCVTKWF